MTASFLFLYLYCVFWVFGGLLGIQFLGFPLTTNVWKCLTISAGLKFCDILFQYMVIFTNYLCTKQITAGFLALIGGNFLCVLPFGIAAYCPFGLSSMVRMGTIGTSQGIMFLIAFDIQILMILVLGLWNLRYRYRRLFR